VYNGKIHAPCNMKAIKMAMGVAWYVIFGCDEILCLTINLGYLLIVILCKIGQGSLFWFP
jgi:hypothetical protein